MGGRPICGFIPVVDVPDSCRHSRRRLPDEVELTDSRLPARLSDLPNPPRVLYLRGELPRGPAVAVVGTRKPTPGAAHFARQLAGELAAAGVTVLSGGAEGIDASAHRGALQVGGVTVVVAPSGLRAAIPRSYGVLFRRIVRHGGAHVSLWRADVKASEPNFFARNRVMVALAHAVVVVEAPFRSGARNTAKHARTLGRPLFVVPSVPWNPKGAGCILELGLGARPLGSARDVLLLLEAQRLHAVAVPQHVDAPGARGSESQSPASESPTRRRARSTAVRVPSADRFLGPRTSIRDENRVLSAIRGGADHPDAISARTGLEVGQVQAVILTLTLSGALVPDSAGRFRLISQRDH